MGNRTCNMNVLFGGGFALCDIIDEAGNAYGVKIQIKRVKGQMDSFDATSYGDKLKAVAQDHVAIQRLIKKSKGLSTPGAFSTRYGDGISRSPAKVNWLTLWDLIKFLLPHKARARTYAPAAEELKTDYLESFTTYTGFWSRLWLRFCFTLRTLLLLADCWRVLGLSKLGVFKSLVPDKLKRWWLGSN